tara:strand:+ start:230 stop:970 length:741 start_codon:yes stop_codon:yes gene_type:complete
MKNKILVLGGSGQLGSYLKTKRYFKGHCFPTKKTLDITKKSILKKYIEDNKINLILNCAAIARMRECEKNRKNAYNVNVKGCKNLVAVIKELPDKNIKLVHISSDAVYPSIHGNYSEKSKLKPYNFYGKTKILSEKIIKKLNNFIIIRTRFFIKNNIKFNTAAIDSYTSSIEVNKLIKYIIILIKKNFKGTINVGGKRVSDYKLYKKYKKIKICFHSDIQSKLDFKISKDASMRCDKLKKFILNAT